MTGLWMISGNLRSGKTLFMTWLAYQQHKNGIPVLANYNVTFADLVAPAEILIMRIDEYIEKYDKCLLIIDDLHRIMDSRDSTTGENKIATDVTINSGKDGMTIAGTSQLSGMVDLRYRDIADYKVLCERLGKTKSRDARIKAWIGMPNFRADRSLSLEKRIIRVGDVCDLYDTTEKIQTNRRLKMKLWAQVIKEKEQETVDELHSCETLTEMRDLLQTYLGVKRAEQVALLKQLGVR